MHPFTKVLECFSFPLGAWVVSFCLREEVLKKFPSAFEYHLQIFNQFLIIDLLKQKQKTFNSLVSFQYRQTVNISGGVEQPLGLKSYSKKECKNYFIFLSLLGTTHRDQECSFW